MSDDVDVAIVGGGIGGLTAAWELARAGRRVTVLEGSQHWGGLLRPLDIGGVIVDGGPEAFAVRRPEIAELCAELGLATEVPVHGSWLLTPQRGAFRSPERAMLGIPADPVAEDVVAAIGGEAARRAAQDAELGPEVGAGEADLAALVTVRMGSGLLDNLVRPLVSAIHGADPARLPVDAVMPGLREALRRTGSLATAVAALLPDGPPVAAVTGGMYRLADALATAAREAGATLVPGTRVSALERSAGGRWLVDTGGPETVSASEVILATSGAVTMALLAPHADTSAIRPRPGAPATHAVLLLAAPELDEAPRGSGIIAAECVPGAKALTHVTAKWQWAQEAAGPGRHVVRLSYGRPGQDPAPPETAEALTDASRLLGIDLQPEHVLEARVVRHDGALAPADPVMREAVLALAERVSQQGLHLGGSLVAGTGLPAIVTRSRAMVAAMQ